MEKMKKLVNHLIFKNDKKVMQDPFHTLLKVQS